MLSNRVGWLVVGLTLVAAAVAVAAVKPVAVSPGDATVSLIAESCPTFTWGAAARAKSYELAVYAIEDRAHGDEVDLSAMKRVFRARIPGGALAWTPSLSDCLEPGRSYAWAVRARVGVAWTEWSEVSLFRVDAGPSLAEVERALDTLSRFMAAGGRRPAGAVPAEVARVDEHAGTQGSGSPSPRSPQPGVAIDTGDADETALRVESSASSGKTFGIHGISVSTSPDVESAGVVGEAVSPEGFGGIFKNTATGGAGLIAVGGSFDAPDIVLGKTDCGAGGDDGVIASDPVCDDSDIFLEAKDAVVAQIGENLASAAHFLVWAFQDSDGSRKEVFSVDESGEVLLGIFGTGRARLTKDALELNTAESRTFDFRNVGSGSMTVKVNGDPLPPPSSLLRNSSDQFETGTLTFNTGTTLNLDSTFDAAGATTFKLPANGIEGGGAGSGLNADRLDGLHAASFSTPSSVNSTLDQHLIDDHVKIAFVTAATWTGNLGGLAGADSKCQAEAAAAGLTGLFKAWLSGNDPNGEEARDRLRQFPGRYLRTDAVKVDDSWAQLTNGDLDFAINRTAISALPTLPASGGTYHVWTNAGTNGAIPSNGSACNPGGGNEWTSSSSLDGGRPGLWNENDSDWTNRFAGNMPCNNEAHLYCLEQ